MSSPKNDSKDPSLNCTEEHCVGNGDNDAGVSAKSNQQAAKRRLSNTVIEISDTDSDDSDVCAVKSYQASADEVKRIRKDYTSSSSSSSSEYSSDSESPWEDDSFVIEDKFETKAYKAQLNVRANRMDDPQLNPSIQSQEVIERLRSHWKDHKDLSSDEATLTCSPFRVCRLHNLLANSEIINNIVDDMNTLDWTRKKMDLYEFHQTTDLANLTWQRSIRGIYQLIKTELKNWVSSVTGLELEGVSASCSLYGPGDHLLLHDDRLADRRVAFILYLAPWGPPHRARLANGDTAGDRQKKWCGWAEEMGGALELLARDSSGAPADVERRLYPANNTLAFFQVGHDSYHQVSEVLSMELPRLSINGWFHGVGGGEEAEGEEAASEEEGAAEEEVSRPHTQTTPVQQWLAPAYMSARARAQVQAQMERASEVCLREVLLAERAEAAVRALDGPDVPWQRSAGARRRCEVVARDWLEAEGEHEVRALARLVSSAAWVRVLGECTDLALSGLARLEVQRWRRGDFSLLPARAAYGRARLEAALWLGAPTHALRGGQAVWVAPEEGAGEALVSVPPAHNALSLVYCDAGAASFTKYLSKLTMAEHERFYVLACTYYE